ncbi:6,7-dimethyl-8-ribityllumazine synthase, partial [Streptomyces sp. tea 10]|nr:6,7-dimethyl-8-ribityllumazine synthase [Streptomyces sp. tea 10]
MSGHGAPTTLASDLDASDLTVAVVAASWHTTIMDGLLDGALRALTEANTGTVVRVRVPGSFELPVAARRLAETADAVVALGVVIRGGTPHFDYVCHAATSGLTD